MISAAMEIGIEIATANRIERDAAMTGTANETVTATTSEVEIEAVIDTVPRRPRLETARHHRARNRSGPLFSRPNGQKRKNKPC